MICVAMHDDKESLLVL